MAPKLYKLDVSPPVRAVYLTAEALGVELEHVEVNFPKGESLKPEFKKLNPQHTIPTLDDDGKIIWDSHAIIIYLVSKYGKDNSLYPEDPYERAVINQRLHFESGVLFALIRAIVRPMVTKGVKTIPEHLIQEVFEAYAFLNKFLEGHQWVAGDQLTIADFSVLSSTTSLNHIAPIDADKYPNVVAWIQKAEQLPYYKVNQKGLNDFKDLVERLLS
ncbi:hypothetical protein ILUMI_18047 [Ignelater luminosus]|uniref:Uncharacterized protein n=1 Tax=Ignelater luminosus TaxID=2038154 RepID=A0A8K0CM48_IGNLU|nr:hypothetical protein ILUMI_18047 [Ignelater luminosus]